MTTFHIVLVVILAVAFTGVAWSLASTIRSTRKTRAYLNETRVYLEQAASDRAETRRLQREMERLRREGRRP